MTRNAQTTAAAIAIAGAITVVAAAGSFPAYACSGQGIGAATAVDPASTPTSGFAPSTTGAMSSRDEASSSGGESVARKQVELLRAAREALEAQLEAYHPKASDDGGSAVPNGVWMCK